MDKPDTNEANIYETIDKRVKSNQRKQAELQRSSTVSTGTAYESIDRKNKPTMPHRSNTVSADVQPTRSPYLVPEEKHIDQDVTNPYIIGKTLERQAKPKVTDIYDDTLVNATNRESINRDSLNLEMFAPASDVMNWQAVQGGIAGQPIHEISSPSTDDKTTATHATSENKTVDNNQLDNIMGSLTDWLD